MSEEIVKRILFMPICHLLMTSTVALALLVPTSLSSLADAGHSSHHNSQQQVPETPLAVKLETTTDGPLVPGETVTVTLTLSHVDDNSPMTLDDLREVHTEKIHLLIVDPSLRDYHHEHPIPTGKPGEYQFSFTPNTTHDYRIWIDITPVDGNQQYAIADLEGSASCAAPCVRETVNTSATVAGYTFDLSFDVDSLTTSDGATGSIRVRDEEGRDVTTLEPILGAFAHLVGYEGNYTGIAHIHPLGEEPSSLDEHSGPELKFFMRPKTAGYLKLFAQVKIDGQILFVPFDLDILQNQTMSHGLGHR